jgi:osmotically-inducible protein OsmY
MKKLAYLLLTMSFIGCTTVACATSDKPSTAEDYESTGARTTGAAWDDQSLARNLASTLNDMYPGNNIETTAYNRNVLLTGQVSSQKIKNEVEKVAQDYPGVRKIHNYLTIGKKESLAQKSKDAWITTKAKSKLVTLKGVEANNIKVVTTNGVVYLFGVVTKHQAIAIKNNLRRIDGVKRVVTFFEYK